MSNYKTTVVVRLEVYGLHQWRQCNSNVVPYLAHKHRHKFSIAAYFRVASDKRQIEFITISNGLNEQLRKQFYVPEYGCLDFDNMSCEEIAAHIFRRFKGSAYRVEVYENDEGGAIVERVEDKE
jgi:hypothetical protein